MRIKSKIIGKRIKKARNAANMSQLELAEGIGLSVKAVSAYEVSRVFPSVFTLKKIADLTGFTIGYFLDEEDVEALEMSARIKRIEKELAKVKTWMENQQEKFE